MNSKRDVPAPTTDSAAPAPTRRAVLAGTVGGLFAAGAGVPLATATPVGYPAPFAGRPGKDRAARPVTMAMHVHGSFSEGIASYEVHLEQARMHDVDVIWWTDHDFRVNAHDHRREVHFDGASEYEGPLEWTWTEETEGDLTEYASAFVDDPYTPDEPGRALLLTATGDGGVLWQNGSAWNTLHNGSLADNTLQLDVLADETGPGRELILEINSSLHPPRNGRPKGRYLLQYRIGAAETGAVRHEQDGLRGVVTLPAPRGRWHRLTLRPVDDIATIWPDLVAEDNSMHRIRVGVSTADGARTVGAFDRFRIDYGARFGDTGVDLRRSVLARYAEEYPDVVHYESFEVSLVKHLNWFGGELALPEMPSPPYRSNDPDLTAEMIEFMHDQGALAQWNHPLDKETPQSLIQLMIDRDMLGADIMEIGREPFEDLRDVFDAAARNALFITGVGVSDDHAGWNWLTMGNNNITAVWAHSTEQDDLVAALAAGRAWWMDPARWRGTLDLEMPGRRRVLGSVLITDAVRQPVIVTATDLPEGGSLHVIEGAVDYAGVAEPLAATETTIVSADDLEGGRIGHVVDPGPGRFIRAQVRDADDAVVGESNPFWILREEPPHGVPAARRVTGS